MSISKQIKELKRLEKQYQDSGLLITSKALGQATDTIEALSAKLIITNIEQLKITKVETVLISILEQCNTIQQTVLRSLKYGIEQLNSDVSNAHDILFEFIQFQALIEILQECEKLPKWDDFAIETMKNNKKSKINENQTWNIITEDVDSYPECFKYVLVEDKYGDKNIACCDTEFNWFVSNCENSIKLIGEVVKWIEID